MRILHTSDWHLGKQLFSRKRYDEFDQFLLWLKETIVESKVNVLVVAGDIFDTGTPSNQAQEQYFNFLFSLQNTCCHHVIVVGGNHDSPTFLNAPRAILKGLNIHIIGCAFEDINEEIIELKDTDGQTQMIVCAVPYLRDADIRRSEAGESIEDKDRKVVEGVRRHYKAIGEQAESLRRSCDKDIPIVGTGHLFAAGGQMGDGVRELYVGNLGRLDVSTFPECMDYVALGHLHLPQRVGEKEHIRYCGAPLPMGFGEAKQTKEVCLVDFEGRQPTIHCVAVPVFRKLIQVSGDWESIEFQLKTLLESKEVVWVEVVYTGEELLGDLQQRVRAVIEDSLVDVLKINNPPVVKAALRRTHSTEKLEDLNEQQVFERCLNSNGIPEEQRPRLVSGFNEILKTCQETDTKAQ